MKRLFDFLAAFFALLIFFPALVVLIIAVRIVLGAPVFFCQLRPGIHGQPFMLFKLRTMRDAFDINGEALADDLRMTRLGSFLRSTSLDELPSLWNVLKGDLSLVGPRPLLMEYLPLYNKFQARRHEVKPGITGWAQVNGRNAIGWEEKFNFDVWYVDHHSFLLDMKILFLTVKKVLNREGIAGSGEVTMSKFAGSES